MKDEKYHEPVMVQEVLNQLSSGAPLKDRKVIDATLGTGGHTEAISAKGFKVLGIEADNLIFEIAKSRLGEACPLVHGNFRDIDQIAKEKGFGEVDAVLFDLGVSNLQLTAKTRGFSFAHPEALLDMRINPENQGVTAGDLLNGLREDQLRELFAKTMIAPSARWLTKKVIDKRAVAPIKTVGDFLAVCRDLRTKPGLNPATLPFLALRMAVNSELENLKEALPKAFELIRVGGRVLVITFHSQEEKVVLDFFKEMERKGQGKVVGPIRPTQEETAANPKSRSAELFVLIREDKNEKKN